MWQRTIETMKQADKSSGSTPRTLHVQPQIWEKLEMCAVGMQKMDKLEECDKQFRLEEMLNYTSAMQRQLEQDFQDDKTLRKQVLPLHMKKQLMERNRAMWLALMAAAFNYATDILFLVKELLPDAKMQNLVQVMVISLSLCLLSRVGAIVYLFLKQVMARDKLFRDTSVKPSILKKGYNTPWAVWYSLMTVIEPTEGLRLLQQAFNEKKKVGTDFRGQDALRDAVANFAALDLNTSTSEMLSIGSGIGIDLINLASQLLYVAKTKAGDPDFAGLLKVCGSLPVAFWVSFAATILHLIFYVKEIIVTWGEREDLKKDAMREFDFKSSDTDEHVQTHAQNIGDSARSVKIKRNRNVTDSALRALGEKCKRLQNVEFDGCRKLIDPNEGWLPLVTNCSNLLHISLSFNEQVEDSWIMPLPKHCPSLQKVCLKKCTRITDASVQALTRLQNLKQLVVSQCPNLTDDAFIGYYKIQALHWVAIDGLEKLTREGIRKLLQRCGRNLEVAYLDGLKQLDDVRERVCRL